MNIPKQKNNSKKVIFLFGPTAVGKTDLLCSFFSSGFEVVNADSVQVYRHLDIGSAKADKSVTDIIPHHLIDILDPWENFNVSDFISSADDACEKIYSNGNTPILSGGTAYYFKHFMYGLSDAPKAEPEVRNEVASWMKEVGHETAYKYLREIDPESAARINVNDSYRISRALEVYKASGKPLSSFKVPDTPRNNMDVTAIGLCRDKSELDSRIRERVGIMFKAGLIDEIKKLIDMGADLSWQSMQAIGYREFLVSLEANDGDFGKLDFDDIAKQIVMNSIHYAKRQMTFFRSFADVHWISPDNTDELEDILKL